MQETLVVIGLACVIGAVVGGGLSLLGVDVPAISSIHRQVLLAAVGVVVIVGAFTVARPPDEHGTKGPAVAGRGAADTPDPPRPGLPAKCASELQRMPKPVGTWERRRPSEAITVDPRPSAIAVTGRFVWVVHENGRVTRFSPDTAGGRVRPLPKVQIGRAGTNGQVSIAVGSNAVWVTKREPGDRPRGFLARIDAASSARSSTLTATQDRHFPAPDNVAFNAGSVWVTSDENRLYRVHPSEFPSHDTSHHADISGEPHGLWAGSFCVYVATTDLDGFSVFDAVNGERLGSYAAGGAGEITASAGALWLTGRIAENRLLHVRPEEPSEAQEIPLSIRRANDVLTAGKSGVWTAGGENLVIWIDPVTRRVRDQITLAGRAGGVGIDPGAEPGSEVVWVTERVRAGGRHETGIVARISTRRSS